MRISRRKLLLQSAKVSAAAGLLQKSNGLLALPQQTQESEKKLRIVVTGGHPGDPECGCGGTIARYTDGGHEAILLYLNRGEGYCGQSDLKDCAKIRTAEAEKACEILKARPLFATQYDGRVVVDAPHYEEFSRLLLEQKPEVVFTHWPTDAHRDHRAISALALDAWLSSKKSSRCTTTKWRKTRCDFPPQILWTRPASPRAIAPPATRTRHNNRTNGFRCRWR